MRKGFTIIEVLVVVAVVGIMTAVMLVSLSDSRSGEAVKVAAREVAAVVRAAQTYAVSGRITDPDKIPCEYRFVVVSPDTYQIQYTHHPRNDDTCVGPETVTSFTLPAGLTVSGVGSIRFSVPNGELVPPLSSGSHTIVVSGGGNSINICVDPGGLVRENC